MAFSDIFGGVAKSTIPSSGFGSLFANLPTQQLAQRLKLGAAQQDQQVAEQQAQYANSFAGIADATKNELVTRAFNIPINFAKSLFATYSQTPAKIIQNTSEAFSTLNPTDILSGKTQGAIGKAIFRNAGDLANAVFAPLSSAIGAALTATGGQNIIDATGKVIADKSGITDVPAFQQFAMIHPNAGEDFNRLLTLALSGAEKGSFDPVRVASEAKAVASKLVTPSTAKTPVEPTPFSSIIPSEPVKNAAPSEVATSIPVAEIKTPTAEQAVSSRGSDLLKAAVKKKLIDTVGDLPTHDKINFEQQANGASDFAETQYKDAIDVAMGRKLPPKEFLPEAIYTAVEEKAIMEGDVATIQELSNSKIPVLAGQGLKALDLSNPESPVRLLRDIQNTTGQKVVKKIPAEVKSINDSITKEISAGSAKRPTWDAFIESLTCGI